MRCAARIVVDHALATPKKHSSLAPAPLLMCQGGASGLAGFSGVAAGPRLYKLRMFCTAAVAREAEVIAQAYADEAEPPLISINDKVSNGE